MPLNWNTKPLFFFFRLYGVPLSMLMPRNLTACSRVFLEKLTGSQLVMKLPALYGTRRFITAFVTAHHVSLFWARSIQSMPPKIHFSIILPCTSGTFKCLIYPRFSHQNPVRTFCLPHTCNMARQSHSSWFDYPDGIRWGVQIMKLLIV